MDSNHLAPFETIVACVDFTPPSREVVEHAKHFAAQGAGSVDFLHAYDPPWHKLRHVLPALSSSQDLQDQYVSMLERQLKDLGGEISGLTVHQVPHEAPLHQSGIATYARSRDADLIVLALRSQTASNRSSGVSRRAIVT